MGTRSSTVLEGRRGLRDGAVSFGVTVEKRELGVFSSKNQREGGYTKKTKAISFVTANRDVREKFVKRKTLLK